MKKIFLMALAALTIFTSCQNGGSTSSKRGATSPDSVSIAFGTLVGYSLKQTQGINLDLAKFQAAFAASYNAETDDEAKLEEANAYIQNYMMTVVPTLMASEENSYLEKLDAEGVQKTESGLRYKIIEAGDVDNKPTAADEVTVHYKGTTTDGEEFDSSYSRNEPATFPLNGVIKGWTEGLQLVGKGGKINLYIPSELAYGTNGPLANKLLVFEVELLDIKKAE